VESVNVPDSGSHTSTPPLGDPDFNPAPAEAEAESCPKCQAKLIDPSGLGWCRACGYCKSLEEDKNKVPAETTQPAAPQPSALGFREFAQMLAKLPHWVRALLAGAAVIVAINLIPACLLAADTLPRAVVATTEIVIGLLVIFVAQTWALCVLAPDDDKLHFKDAIIPGRLWGVALRKLPGTRGQVWLAGWGLTCILSAVFVVGSLTHWLNYLPKKSSPPPAATKKA
jgi:hypothetical protein